MEKVNVPPISGGRRYSRHLCQCKCGTKSVVLTDSLLRGSSTQCRECRNKLHPNKVKIEDGILVAIRLPVEYQLYLRHRFGSGRAVGKGVRAAIKAYRDSGIIKIPGDHLRSDDLRPTSVVMDLDDKQWLAQNHQSILDGILSAIDYFLFSE